MNCRTSVTVVSARWATVDWSWPKEWNSFTRANLHLKKKKKKAQVGNEMSNILPKFFWAGKKPPPPPHSRIKEAFKNKILDFALLFLVSSTFWTKHVLRRLVLLKWAEVVLIIGKLNMSVPVLVESPPPPMALVLAMSLQITAVPIIFCYAQTVEGIICSGYYCLHTCGRLVYFSCILLNIFDVVWKV